MQTAARIPFISPAQAITFFPVAVAASFSNATLSDALGALADVAPTWLHSWDGEANLRRLVQELDLYAGILEDRQDEGVRDIATATLRQISAIFRRDHGHGLVAEGMETDDLLVLLSPDAYEQTI